MIYQYKKITAIIFLAFLFFPSFTSLATEEPNINFLTLHSIHPASFPIPVKDDKGIITQHPNIMGHKGPWVEIDFSSSRYYLDSDLRKPIKNAFTFNKDKDNKEIPDELLDINFNPFFQHRISLNWQGFYSDHVNQYSEFLYKLIMRPILSFLALDHPRVGPHFELLPKDIMWSILSLLALDHPRVGIIPLMNSCKSFKNLMGATVTEEVIKIQQSLKGFKYRFPHHQFLNSENPKSWNERRLISSVQQNQLLWGSWCGNSDAQLLLLETNTNDSLYVAKEILCSTTHIAGCLSDFHFQALALQRNINFLDHLIKSCNPEDKILLSHLSAEYLENCRFVRREVTGEGTPASPRLWGDEKCFLPIDRKHLEKIASYVQNCVFQHDYNKIDMRYRTPEKVESFIGCLLDAFLMGRYNRPIPPETREMKPRTAEEKKDDINIVGDLMTYWNNMTSPFMHSPFKVHRFSDKELDKEPKLFLYAEIFKDKDRFLEYLSDMIP